MQGIGQETSTHHGARKKPPIVASTRRVALDRAMVPTSDSASTHHEALNKAVVARNRTRLNHIDLDESMMRRLSHHDMISIDPSVWQTHGNCNQLQQPLGTLGRKNSFHLISGTME